VKNAMVVHRIAPQSRGAIEEVDRALVILDEIHKKLGTITSIEGAKKAADFAALVGSAAKRARKGLKVQNHCAFVRLSAERRAGELLTQMDRLRGRPKKGSHAERLSDIGIEYNDSHRWRAIAKLSAEDLERMWAECDRFARELTAAYVRRNLKSLLPKEEYVEVMQLWGQHWAARPSERQVYDAINALYRRLDDLQPGTKKARCPKCSGRKDGQSSCACTKRTAAAIIEVIVHDRSYLNVHDIHRLLEVLTGAQSLMDRCIDGLERRLAG